MNSTEAAPTSRPVYKRKVRNYLLDVGLQLRYTATIVVVAIFLTAGLGFKMYQATRDVSKVILWTSLVDPASADELQSQFANSDRVVLWGIVGFGVVGFIDDYLGIRKQRNLGLRKRGKLAGQVIVADGTAAAARRLERVLTSDPAMGVLRHADAGYEEAIQVAREKGVSIPGITR